VQAHGEQRLTPALFSDDEAGLICTGIQKLAQRVLLELLTATGSMKGLERRGCGLVIAMKTGRINTDVQAAQEFTLAALDATANLQGEETENDPSDERLHNINLLSVAFLMGHVSYHVEVISLAGSSRKVVLPISVAT
jgi:hypothetical protein